MTPNLLFILSVSISFYAICVSYPTGAPQETCKIFTANHTGYLSQKHDSKYNILIGDKISSGEIMTVTIKEASGTAFKGFFIQGQDATTKQPIGKFKEERDVSQTRDCSGPGSSDSATHVNDQLKPEVQLKWQAPTSFKGKVIFRAVVVEEYERFWDNIRSAPIDII